MVGIVVVTHGQMAEGLVDATRTIVGEIEGIVAVCLAETDSVEGLTERVAAAIAAVDGGEGALVLVDLFGASPFNASARLALQAGRNVEVISGVNLPMLVELVVQRGTHSFEQLVDIALKAGVEGIRTLSQALAEGAAP